MERGKIVSRDEKGNPKRFVGIHLDITERKQAEGALQEGEERQRSLIEAVSRAGILLFVVDNEYKVRYMNEPMIAGFGDATGRICYLEVGGLDSPCEYCQVSKVIGDGERVHYQPTVADGRTFDIIAVPYTDIDGTRCKLEIIQDVTSQMQAEEALRESEEKFRTFTEMAPVGVFVTGADGLTTYWNKRLCDITGMQVVDGLGTGWADGVHPDDRERVFKEWYESAEKRASFSCEYRFVDRDGAVTHTIGQASPLIDASSRVTGYVGTITDVTDLKQAEVALWESKDFFTQMFVQSKTSTQLFDPDGNCIRVNPEFCNLFGVTEKDITSGYNIFNDQAAIDSGVIPLVRQIFDDKKANKWQINFDIETASVSTNTHSTRKEKIWIDVLGYPVLDRNGSLQYVVLQHYDITEQKQAKEALKRAHDNLEMQVKERTAELIKTNEALHASEVRFRTIYENAPALISAFEKNGRCILWNKECEKVFGWTMEEINSHDNPLSLLYPDPSIQKRAMKSVTIEPDAVFKEWHPLTKYGSQLITIWANFQLPDGAIINLGYDVTENKLLEDQMIRSERLAATGQLAASIAHEINSPLQGITILLNSIASSHKGDEKLLENLDLVKGGFVNIRDIVKKLLDLNRPGKENKQTMNINGVIEDTATLLKNYLKKCKVKIFLNLSSKVPDITASPQQLGQVFINLVNNAVEAMMGASESKDGGKSGEITHRTITINSNRKKNNIIIKVVDTGPGISKEDLEHIFDPFYTRKKKMGMGIGLSICHGIIEDHNGTIAAINSPERGTVFTITLPIENKP